MFEHLQDVCCLLMGSKHKPSCGVWSWRLLATIRQRHPLWAYVLLTAVDKVGGLRNASRIRVDMRLLRGAATHQGVPCSSADAASPTNDCHPMVTLVPAVTLDDISSPCCTPSRSHLETESLPQTPKILTSIHTNHHLARSSRPFNKCSIVLSCTQPTNFSLKKIDDLIMQDRQRADMHLESTNGHQLRSVQSHLNKLEGCGDYQLFWD